MKGIDTNILLRLFVGDDPKQQRQALAFIETNLEADGPFYVNRVVICEFAWSLARLYGYDRAQISIALERLILTSAFLVEDAALIHDAIGVYKSGGDFADAVVAASNFEAGCTSTITLDATAARRIDGFELLRR